MPLGQDRRLAKEMESSSNQHKSPVVSAGWDKAVSTPTAYRPVLKRTFGLLEGFAASFCAMNFIGVTRMLLFIGLTFAGPQGLFTTSLITIVGVTVTAAVLAEICSALPLNGSIYVWASEAAGKRWGRLAGFVVGWW